MTIKKSVTKRKKQEKYNDDGKNFYALYSSWLVDRSLEQLETILLKNMEIDKLKDQIKQLEAKIKQLEGKK